MANLTLAGREALNAQWQALYTAVSQKALGVFRERSVAALSVLPIDAVSMNDECYNLAQVCVELSRLKERAVVADFLDVLRGSKDPAGLAIVRKRYVSGWRGRVVVMVMVMMILHSSG